MMKVVKTIQELRANLDGRSKVGFVPTMGALHDGHISLVERSLQEGNFTVVSIFVNPTQFNNPEDLSNYPIDIDGDLTMLENAGCHLVFLPSKEEVYHGRVEQSKYLHSFGEIETRLEGSFRPGHFKGVAQVVHILFDIVHPQVAYFGEKDFQQLAIIKQLVQKEQMPVRIVGVATKRDPDGLAMSSRNRRLSSTQREHALLLFRSLKKAEQLIGTVSIEEIKNQIQYDFEKDALMQLEYFEIIDGHTFQDLRQVLDHQHIRGVIAAYSGEVRLIDNIQLA